MATLFIRLAEVGRCYFECAGFYDTARDDHEFIIALRPSNDKERVVGSWEKVSGIARSSAVEIHDQEASILKAKILLMEQSRSWRITKPLRVVSAFLAEMKSR